MDRTHVLAAQTLPRKDRDHHPTKAEIDAFYDAHGHEVFARVFRLRRWFHSRATRPGRNAGATARFAPLAANR